jgi:2-keto-3-deoxy-L-rhamnonate aldolase RhmA
MVETCEQAEKLAAWCRYRPEGVRGLAFGMPHDDYEAGDVVATMRAANERTLVIAMIETERGVEAVDEILSVPGIDIGWLGHFDLTNSLGITAQWDHPRFGAAVDRFLAACERHRKVPGILAGDPATLAFWARRGFRCLCYSLDVALLQNAFRDGVARVRAELQTSSIA